MKTRSERNHEAATAEIVVEPSTGAWTLRGEDGTAVAAGEWAEVEPRRFHKTKAHRQHARHVIRVPLAYDPSVYFDTLVDRRRAEDRGDMLRTTLETALRALDLAANQAPANGAKIAADMVRATLSDAFEVSVVKEIEERRETEGRKRTEERRRLGAGGDGVAALPDEDERVDWRVKYRELVAELEGAGPRLRERLAEVRRELLGDAGEA